ncbi:MAG: purine-nucleoside phosphorylase [Candidatus Neomarinimicrobiota bacterium]|tara:strand:+ start:352 stop:1155 length:804 start_codon:yes stop_codon:yes gene_type:complete
MSNIDKEEEASNFILRETSFSGKTAIILGSGLGEYAKILTEKKNLAFSKIPYYPISNVEGHAGELVSGKIFGIEILIAKGRVHCYEGYSLREVTFPIRVFKKCGIKNLIITNSSGSLEKKNKPGTLMLIKGHLDCSFQKNYHDINLVAGDKYHSKELIKLSEKVAFNCKIKVLSGNYCWVLGPSYETPEEINFFKLYDGNAVGMSTLPEIEEAGAQGLRVLSIALLTNYAAGIGKDILSHKDVMEVASQSKTKLMNLLSGIIKGFKE